MKKLFVIFFLPIFSFFLSALETGRILDTPFENIKSLKTSYGVMVSKNFVKNGFVVEKVETKMLDQVFSILKFKKDILVGTGGNAYIFNVTKNDTVAKFREGEIIKNILKIDEKSFIASVEPSGIIVKIDDKKKCDTLFKNGNKSINKLLNLDGEIYALVGENIFELKKNRFEKFFEVKDRNCLQMKRYKKGFLFSTEGEGKLINYQEGKTDYIFVSNGSEIKDFFLKDDKIFILLNSKISNTDDPLTEEYKSYIISIENNLLDTLFFFDTYISQVGFFKDGVTIFLSKPARAYFFDFKDLFFCGNFDFDFVTSVYKDGENLLVGNDGKPQILKIKDNNGKGEFLSRVFAFNSKNSITSVYPEFSGKVKVFFRFGESYDVDKNWTDFYQVFSGLNSNLPKAKFFQYKVVLNDDEDKFKKIEIFYKGENRKPKIENIVVFPPRILPDYAMPQNVITDKNFKKNLYMDLKEQNISKIFEKKIFVRWEGFDPDNDRLSYSIFLNDRRYDYPLISQTEDNYIVFNYENFQTGYYRIKVLVSDSIENREPLNEEKLSEDFLIDNNPPRIKDDIFQNNSLSFTAFDEESFIDKVEISINGSEFKDVFPVDQIFDNREENFAIDIPFNGKEPLSILVKVYDKFGNVSFLKKFLR
ncbi:MAG: hypothetical protein XD76_0642 [candidate division TA06 bacterium 32_111]|uniref:Uncharacterized protein n=2 Tax=Bacteria candidate phyla TaxID=1783234 RepID=A0A101I2Z7_UNCT6|nr:MAG: hypothetical protein XD76_0642 [candidate division TA06 bacterium 32_111]KUK87828.1 MAG: hypothetical protein XE03_0347 [candidate division TA06 bacterium 34_109]HAF07981.1 hypothetical protein [candidate division WOR-3 bacterium]HCP16317.1 hypothetical protein [candidate division WOR-3 bacterium]